jgi:Domain of unknown function (DUF4383)
MTIRIVRGYLYALMGGLLAQGLGSLLFRLVPSLPDASPVLVRGTFGIDFWHSWIHIVWGAAGLLILGRRRDMRTATWLALAFGAFYTSFGILGLVIHHPLGLQLDSFENAFHLTAGPLTLTIAVVAAVQPVVATQSPAAEPRIDD